MSAPFPIRPVGTASHTRSIFSNLVLPATGFLLVSTSAFAQVTTTGYLNQVRSEAPGTLLSRPNARGSNPGNGSEPIGRTTSLNYLNGWLIVGPESPESRPGSDLHTRVYDISNPTNPIRRFPSDFNLSYPNNRWFSGSIGWGSHGTAQSENLMLPNPVLVPTFGGPVQIGGTGFTSGVPTRPRSGVGNLRAGHSGPWDASWEWYSTPGNVFSLSKVSKNQSGSNVTTQIASIPHVADHGGGEWHPIIFGDLLIYVRGPVQTSKGVVVYRVRYDSATSATPQFVAALPGGIQTYWPNLFSDGTGLYVVASYTNRLMAVDLTAAATPGGSDSITVKAARTINQITNSSYPAYQDHFAFIGRHKIDMTQFLEDGNQLTNPSTATPVRLSLNEEANGVETSQMSLPLGNLWITGGYPRNYGQSSYRAQGMAIWVHQQARDTTRPKVTFHIPQANRTNYSRFAPLSFLIHEHPRRGGLRNSTSTELRDFAVRPVNGSTLGTPVAGFLLHDFAGMVTFTPSNPLAANTTYQVDFFADDNDTPWNPSASTTAQLAALADDTGFQDTVGNLIEPHSFLFSTGSSIVSDSPLAFSGVTSTLYQPAPGAAVTVTASATGGTGTREFRFSFNDGATWTAWSTTNSASSTFATEGRPIVLVQVRDSSGEVLNESITLLVATPPATALRPTQSNTLAAGNDPAGRRVWVVNPDADTVSVLNAETGAKVAEYVVGKNPRSVARDASGRYWVTCHGADEIVVLNNDGTVHSRINTPFGSAPFGVAASPDGSVMYVSLYGTGLIHRYVATNAAAYGGATPSATPVASTDPLPTARAIAISPDGSRVFVTRFLSPELTGEVAEFNGGTLARTRTIALAYASTSDGGDRAAGVPNYLAGIAISPDGKRAAVVSKQDNVMRGPLFGVSDLTFETTVRSVISFLNLETHAEIRNSRRDLDNSDSPSAVTYSPFGDMLLVAVQGNNTVVGIDVLNLAEVTGTSAPATTVTTPIGQSFSVATGQAPQGVLLDTVSNRLFVQNFMGRSVSIRNAADFVVRNTPAFGDVANTGTVANEPLPANVLLGKRIFYDASDPRMSADSYISCASCHVDGGHDGRVWDFTGRGEGLRRTTDLRGRAGLGDGHVHWSANFDEIQDFEHHIRTAFSGSGFLDLTSEQFADQHPSPATTKAGLSPDLDALAAYVTSLDATSIPRSPARAVNGALTEAAVRGREVFQSQSCVVCHQTSRYTDSMAVSLESPSLRNIGTLSPLSGSRLANPLAGIDTPTLVGLHSNRLFLHGGQASSLEEVFSYAGGRLTLAKDGELINPAAVTIVTKESDDGGGGIDRGLVGGSMLAFVAGSPSPGVRFTGVDGGSGGPARIALRYVALYGNKPSTLTINGVPQGVTLLMQSPSTGFHVSGWSWLVVETILNPGPINTVEFVTAGGDVRLNALLVANAEELTRTAAHRRVTALPEGQRNDLVAYLRQLDGRNAAGLLEVGGVIYRETFANAAGSIVRINIPTIGWQQLTSASPTANVTNTSSVSNNGGVTSNPGRPADLTNVNAGPFETSPNGFAYTQNAIQSLMYTTEFSSDRSAVSEMSWYSQISAIIGSNSQSAAVRINGQWYVTAPSNNLSRTGSAGNFSTTAEIFQVNLATAEWRTLTATEGAPFAVGTTAVTLPAGTIGAVGVYFAIGGNATTRFDSFTVTGVPSGPMPTPLQAWKIAEFDPVKVSNPALETSLWGRQADPDQDGMINLLEFALNADPRTSDAQLRQPTSVPDPAGRLSLSFLRARSDLNYIIEASTGLEDWQTIATNPGVFSETVPVVVTDSVVPSPQTPLRFLRLRVEEPAQQ